jgi:pimeloyl-ACP methyl ester carboxylesterase
MSTVSRREFRYSDDVVISYEVEGAGPTPVVFLHGFAAALTTWDDIRGLFPADRYRLYFLDLKGFGHSSKPHDGAYRPTDQATVVAAFLADQGLRKTILVGHSLGGGIALLTLLDAQAGGKGDLVDGLVLIACAAYPQRLPPVLRLLRVPILGWAILHLLPVPFMVKFTLTRLYHDRKAVTPQRIARYIDSFGRRGIAHVLIESARHLVPEDYARIVTSYRDIAVPVLIIWGMHDPIISLQEGTRLHHAVPASRLVVIDACGHIPQEESPEKTYAAIADFLAAFDHTAA